MAEMMRIEQWDPADERAFQGCNAVMRAATLVDEPVEPPMSAAVFRVYLTEGFDHDPGEVWLGYGDDGAVAGYYRLNLPDLENRDRADLGLTVHPDARRRGLGLALLRHGAGRAAANGRAIMEAVTAEDGAGDAFARAVGATFTIAEVRRIQHLGKIAPGTVAGLRAEAERASAGYSLVEWAGPIPRELQAGAAAVANAFNDAPHPDGVEDAQWDADRIAERTGTLQRRGVVARSRRGSGQRRVRRDGRLHRGADRPRVAPVGAAAAHRRGQEPPGAPARAAAQGRDAGAAGPGRAAAGVDRDR